MRRKITQAIRSTRTAVQLLGWQQVYRAIKQDSGMKIVPVPFTGSKRMVLVIAPHPDDDVFGCGGVLAYHHRRGDEVHVLYITDGSRGTPSGEKQDSLVSTRHEEAQIGANHLGGGDLHFWNMPDGEFKPTAESTATLRKLIQSLYQPIIYCPWIGDNHPEHQFATRMLYFAIKEGTRLKGMEIWQYEVWSPLVPNRIVPIAAVLDKKKKAIKSHKSQLTSRNYSDGILALNTYRGMTLDLDGPAEAFFALDAKDFLTFYDTTLNGK